ncbi:MAG TPA: GNAT family N-acetyltransferase [Candidatus Saccharimonadales bacterium]|nr:GNAT family N-acetyltransferase [Candidatus Saccharimonadales bacterium]
MKLIIPMLDYEKSYFQAVEEGKDETGITRIESPKSSQSFQEFVNWKINQSKGLDLPEGYVANTELWLIDKDEFIGFVNIRHSLTKHLLKVGGHIGYWIRPTKRHLGYGKEILRLSLIQIQKLRIKKALVTCDDTNSASRKIIESNGGILENIIENGSENPKKRRYWINIK